MKRMEKEWRYNSIICPTKAPSHPEDGRFAVNLSVAKTAVRELAHELLTIEATGDYARAKKLLDEKAIVRPDLRATLDGLTRYPYRHQSFTGNSRTRSRRLIHHARIGQHPIRYGFRHRRARTRGDLYPRS